jgi:hypothetical protein
MEIKRLAAKYVYRIEPKPEGGFIARASDPNVPPIEAATREELQQKIQSTVLAGLGRDFPGLKLPAGSGEMKFSFHVEKQPDGSFDIHSSDPADAPLNAASHDQVESHFAEKLVEFVGKHMLEGAPEALRARLASGDVKVFINQRSGFTLTTTDSSAGPAQQLAAPTSQGGDASSPFATDGPITSNRPAVAFDSSGRPIDSSPITPGAEGSGKFLRIVLVLLAFAAVAFFLLKYR